MWLGKDLENLRNEVVLHEEYSSRLDIFQLRSDAYFMYVY